MKSDPGMTVEVVRAEASRFRHPLVLLHGLWTGGWIWREVAPYLAHRGWDAWIPSFAATVDVAARRQALIALRSELPAPPVFLTNDAGLVVADAVSGDVAAPAIVAMMPVAEIRAMSLPRRWLMRLGAREVRVPSGRGAEVAFAGLDESDRARMATDSASLVPAIGSVTRQPMFSTPGLVIASSDDAAAPLSGCERLARIRGWEVVQCEGSGHFPLLGKAAPRLVDRVHRWLVRAIGRELPVWIEDEEDGE